MNRVALPLQQLCDAAMQAALEAGRFVQSTDRKALQRHFKNAGSSEASRIVTEVDVRSEAIIRECLQAISEQWGIAFVGEESSQDLSGTIPDRLLESYYWCVDPLDGTLPYVEGRPGYAVSIALVDQSGEPLIGVVYDPLDATLMHAIKGQGAYRGQALINQATSLSPALMVYADTSFRTHENYADALNILNACAQDSGLDGVELVYGSGAVKNACQVLEHPAACYLKLPKPENGGGSIWDFAATACIVDEAGGWASNIHGKPLELNRKGSTFMNHQGVLYASNERVARYLIAKLQVVFPAS
ncbi:3'(2'),5'-bisphosphate nucleotidase CysQ family protein [Pseudohalioglobus lutimaris]|uniref:Inositol monophosphatase n=1 Tax=Pseudohalioglobus lutimaris TaxID=1737061 RepID=A0A2N5X5C7_9GAMM|nr:inositol monophosphatase family protein [Pseudohalioglobus lutimaris]PLW69690.1 inositol monophosphatase [Pseudohalioglobus lutimaris]